VRRTWRRWLLATAATSLFAPVLLVLALRLPRSLTLELGPGDAAYVQGNLTPWRLDELGRKWRAVDRRARLSLPVTFRGPGQVVLLIAQPESNTSVLHVSFDDGSSREVTLQPSKEFRAVAVELPVSRMRANLRLRAENARLRISSTRWEGSHPLPQARLLRDFTLLSLGTLGALALAGLSPTVALAGALALALILTAAAPWDPFAFVHWIRAGAPVSAIGLAAVACARVTTSSSPALRVLLYAAVLAKCALLFHPSYWFADLPIHETLLELVYHRGVVDFWRSLPELQVRHHLGLSPVGGVYQPYPYSVLFYLIAHLGNRLVHAPEFWLKATFGLVSALPILPIGALARRLSRERHSDLFASIVYLLAPAYTLALLILGLSSLLGHFFDLLVLAYLARTGFVLGRWRSFLTLTALVAASLAAYNSGFISVGLFFASVLILAAPSRTMDLRGVLRFAAAGIVGAALALSTYHPTTVSNFLLSVVPQGVGSAPEALSLANLLRAASGRLHLFLGLPLLLAGGLGVLRVARDGAISKPLRLLMYAWALSFLAAFVLRYTFRELLLHEKEMYWFAALLAVGAGVLLARVWRIPRWGGWAFALLVGAIAGVAIVRFLSNLPLYYELYRFL
jgi:hypothetical protein